MRGETGADGSEADSTGTTLSAASAAPFGFSMLATWAASAFTHASASRWAPCGVDERAVILMSTVSAGWSTLICPIRAAGRSWRPRSSITPCAVARPWAMSTYDFARDFASESATDPRAGFESLPALTKPVALAA